MRRQFNKRNLTCATCGRGFNEHSVDHICPECFEIAGFDNQVNDNGPEDFSPADAMACARYLADIAKKGGDVERCKAANDYINWSLVPVLAAPRAINRVGSNAPTNGVKAQVRVVYGDKNESYRSLFVAFGQLGLPMKKMQKFRIQLKLFGEMTFDHEGVPYHFFAAGL